MKSTNISQLIKPIPGYTVVSPVDDPSEAVDWGVEQLSLILEGYVGSTQKNYAHAWKAWALFCRQHNQSVCSEGGFISQRRAYHKTLVDFVSHFYLNTCTAASTVKDLLMGVRLYARIQRPAGREATLGGAPPRVGAAIPRPA